MASVRIKTAVEKEADQENIFWSEILLLALSNDGIILLPTELCDQDGYLLFLVTTDNEIKFHMFIQKFIVEMSKDIAPERCLCIVKQIAKHLEYLHSQKQNFLLVYEVVKATIGYAKRLGQKKVVTDTFITGKE